MFKISTRDYSIQGITVCKTPVTARDSLKYIQKSRAYWKYISLRELQLSWEKINKNNLENVLLAPQYGIKILLHLKNDNKQNKKIHQK